MFVHSSRIKKQLEYLASLGVDTKPVYKLAGISQEEVLNPEKMFDFELFQTVFEFALKTTKDEYYGLKMGQEPHIAGTVGMLAASCKNLKEAFEQGCKFFNVQGNFADITFSDDPGYSKITYSINDAWKLKYPETARHEVDSMFSFLTTILKINSNETLHAYRINLTRDNPENNVDYEKIFGSVPNYNSDSNEMIFKESDLTIPMKAFNPETFELLKKHIESQIKKITNEESIIEKVKSVLLSSIQFQFPDIETVASKLNTSARTLQRNLSRENTSFKVILQNTRFDLAKEMLKQNVLTISEISFTLGYSDLGNFSRSFKKYTGLSPQKFRNSKRK